MIRLATFLALLPLTCFAAGGEDACTVGQREVAAKVKAFHGAKRIRQLMDADLARAGREQAEGDVDECLEALDHARQLLAGKY